MLILWCCVMLFFWCFLNYVDPPPWVLMSSLWCVIPMTLILFPIVCLISFKFMCFPSYIDPIFGAFILFFPGPFILIMSTGAFLGCSPPRLSSLGVCWSFLCIQLVLLVGFLWCSSYPIDPFSVVSLMLSMFICSCCWWFFGALGHQSPFKFFQSSNSFMWKQ